MAKVTITIETDDNLPTVQPEVRLPKAQALSQLPKEENKVKKFFTFIGFVCCLYFLYIVLSALMVYRAG